MKHSRNPAAVAIFLSVFLLLGGGYVGSYLALVSPMSAMISSQIDAPPYRWGGRTAARIFWPLEQMDRRIRHQYWEFG